MEYCNVKKDLFFFGSFSFVISLIAVIELFLNAFCFYHWCTSNSCFLSSVSLSFRRSFGFFHSRRWMVKVVRRVQRSHCVQSQCPISAFVSPVLLLCSGSHVNTQILPDRIESSDVVVHDDCVVQVTAYLTFLCDAISCPVAAIFMSYTIYPSWCTLNFSGSPQNVVASVLSNSKHLNKYVEQYHQIEKHVIIFEVGNIGLGPVYWRSSPQPHTLFIL